MSASSFAPEDLPLSYPSLLSVIQHLSYSKRCELAVSSPEIREIHKRTGYSLNSLSFIQKHGDVNEDGESEEVGSAEVHVESIKYYFEFKPETGKVEIECSLTPGEKTCSGDITVARRCFHHFLTTSQHPVRRLFLTKCDRPFRNLTGLQNLDIKWTLDESRETPLFQDFPDDHVFARLKLINYGSILLNEKQVRNCKHLILKKDEVYMEHVIGNEERTIRDFYCSLTNSTLEVRLRLNYVESFILLCERILLDTFQIGSAFTVSFKRSKFLKDYVWSSLLERFNVDARIGMFKRGECVVLQMQNDRYVAVFANYYGDDDDHRESFTAVKIKRNLECELESVSMLTPLF